MGQVDSRVAVEQASTAAAGDPSNAVGRDKKEDESPDETAQEHQSTTRSWCVSRPTRVSSGSHCDEASPTKRPRDSPRREQMRRPREGGSQINRVEGVGYPIPILLSPPSLVSLLPGVAWRPLVASSLARQSSLCDLFGESTVPRELPCGAPSQRAHTTRNRPHTHEDQHGRRGMVRQGRGQRVPPAGGQRASGRGTRLVPLELSPTYTQARTHARRRTHVHHWYPLGSALLSSSLPGTT